MIKTYNHVKMTKKTMFYNEKVLSMNYNKNIRYHSSSLRSVFKFSEVTNFDYFTYKINKSGLNIIFNINVEGESNTI